MAGPPLPLITSHPRLWRENRFVYPVVSRRSGGISIGINLNPDKVCNFDCIYCQVDRRSEAETRFVEIERVLDELDGLMTHLESGALFEEEKFAGLPESFRRLNDVAFSGDGEPTTYRNFDDIVDRVAAVKAAHGRNDVKLVLITNASMFHRPAVERGLSILDANHGEIWAKLEAGTDAYYRRIERTTIPFRQVLDNIAAAARVRPLVIQSLFMRVAGEAPPAAEIEAYCDRLQEILASGGRLSLIQIYTVARAPAESFVTALTRDELDAIATNVRRATGLETAVFPGSA